MITLGECEMLGCQSMKMPINSKRKLRGSKRRMERRRLGGNKEIGRKLREMKRNFCVIKV